MILIYSQNDAHAPMRHEIWPSLLAVRRAPHARNITRRDNSIISNQATAVVARQRRVEQACRQAVNLLFYLICSALVKPVRRRRCWNAVVCYAYLIEKLIYQLSRTHSQAGWRSQHTKFSAVYTCIIFVIVIASRNMHIIYNVAVLLLLRLATYRVKLILFI